MVQIVIFKGKREEPWIEVKVAVKWRHQENDPYEQFLLNLDDNRYTKLNLEERLVHVFSTTTLAQTIGLWLEWIPQSPIVNSR